MIKMRPGLFYLCHPYSAETKEGRKTNFNLCCRRTAKLLLKGYNIFSPIVYSHSIEMVSPEMLQWPIEKRWRFWMNIDIALLEYVGFTGVILAPLWGRSKGCKREYEWFLSHHGPAENPHEILKYNDVIGD